MNWTENRILEVLDKCCEAFSFPVLDNGYFYLAATRLSLYRSPCDWGLVIETFGFDVRAGQVETNLYSFASRLANRDTRDDYVSREAYDAYLANNPHNEFRVVCPVTHGLWQGCDDSEVYVPHGGALQLRGRAVTMPAVADWSRHGVCLDRDAEPQVFEMCRVLADLERDAVLATESERRAGMRSGMAKLMQLEEWRHPDVAGEEERASDSEAFQQLVRVLVSGDPSRYAPTQVPNTHWANWPEGGTL